jgi:hypothetical protein
MKRVLFIGYDAFGDYLSNNGMIRYISKNYDQTFILTNFIDYVNFLLNDMDNITCVHPYHLNNFLNSSEPFDVVDVRVWEKYSCFNPEYCKGTYYDKDNKYLDIKNQEIDDNASSFYSNLGIPINIRLDNFYLERLTHQENFLYKKLNLENKDYAVICEYDNFKIDRKYIKCDNIINLHFLGNNILEVLKIIENAKEIHLLENCISLMVYHLQYKGLMKNVDINFHHYARFRSDFLTNMVKRPELKNWNFIE